MYARKDKNQFKNNTYEGMLSALELKEKYEQQLQAAGQ